MRPFIIPALIVIGAAAWAIQSARSFDFADPKGVNAISFTIDSPLEPIKGFTSVSGKINFDPAAPERTTGALVVDVSSIKMANARMAERLLSDATWLDAAQFKTIEFKITRVSNVRRESGKDGATALFRANVTGDFTMKGTTRSITVPATLTYFKDGLGRRQGNLTGDLVIARAKFPVSRMAYKVGEGMPTDVVGDVIEVDVSIAGSSPNN